MATTTTSSTAFTGQSSFSSDLQQVLTRAVAIANLPVQLLQSQQSALSNQRSALNSLSSKFSSLQNVIDALDNSVGLSSYSSSMDTIGIVSASLGAGATAGTYNINVISLGSHSNVMSASTLPAVSDPTKDNISTSSSFTFAVDSTSYQLTPTDNSLSGLAKAINASGAGVQATIVNIGSASSPSYRLSIQGNAYGSTAISLTDGSNSLLDTLNTGTPVQYQINGQPSTPIESDSRFATIAPGVSVNLLKAGSTNITVAQTASGISNALSAFVSAYNAAVDELGKSRGQNGGALTGQSVIYSLTDSLRTLSGYTQPSGAVRSFSDVGLSFDQDGHLNFDPAVLSSAANGHLSDVLGFLGTENSGGFLQAAGNVLKGLEDSTTGVITQTGNQISSQLSTVATKIQDGQDRVTALQNSLTLQMARSDALISSLEQQVNYYTSLFDSMRQNSKNG
jgi:flagellar hook-associated protein 2